jgi:DNA-binding response OmpR family regulator
MNDQLTKILIIDDEPVLLASLGYLLREEGFSVEIAENGSVGLTKFDLFYPDVVVTDFIMPGINGWEVMKELRDKRPTLPVIMMSGVIQPFDNGVDVSEGAFCHVMKPVDANTIARLIRTMMIPLPCSDLVSH